MAKIVRLKADQHRRYRANRLVLVNEAGAIVRHLELDETLLMDRCLKQAHRTKETFAAELENGVKIVATVVRPDDNPRNAYVEPKVDGLSVRAERDMIFGEIFAQHGECQLRGMNGIVIKYIRDPNAKRLTVKDHRTVPKPEHCNCRAWKRADMTRHHFLCENNKHAPPEERGTQFSKQEKSDALLRAARAELIKSPPKASMLLDKTVAVPGAVKAVATPKPSECVCREWARSDGKEANDEHHHPICEHHDKWEAKHRPEEWIVDLDTGENIRPATPQEIAEADTAEKRGGSRLITIGTSESGTTAYGVMPKVIETSASPA